MKGTTGTTTLITTFSVVHLALRAPPSASPRQTLAGINKTVGVLMHASHCIALIIEHLRTMQ
jgi:hypothetical protein